MAARGGAAGAGGGGSHVRFAEHVHVREHVLLERAPSDRPPFRGDESETFVKPDGSVGTYRTYLSWDVAREYDCPLTGATYESSPTPELATAAASAAASANLSEFLRNGAQASAAAVSANPFSPPGRTLAAADAVAAGGAAAGAPNNTGSGAAATAAQPPAKVIEEWHIKQDGCIYQGPVEHSSTVATVNGNVVTTRSGTRYVLGRLDSRIAAVMARIAGPGTEHPYNPADPLNQRTRQQLYYAESIAYGRARDSTAALVAALAKAEIDLGVPEIVRPQFAAIRDILGTLGIDARVPAAAAAVAGAPAAAATPTSGFGK